MRRFLDVLFEHLRWLALCLVVLPMVAGAVGSLRADPSVVTARIRVDPAGFLGDALSDVLPSAQAPAEAAARQILQLVQTDWPRASSPAPRASAERALPSDPGERSAVLERLRTRLTAAAEGPTVVVVSYPVDQPQRALALVGALVAAFRDTLEAMEAQKAAAALRADSGALERARLDMQRAIDAAGRYAYMQDRTGDELRQDPIYQRLLAEAQVATDHFQSVDTLTGRALAASDAVSGAGGQAAVVVDAPRVEQRSRALLAARSWALGLVGTAAAGLLAVYLVALHDPRLRDLEDVRRQLAGACLFVAPQLSRPPPSQ